jgi:DNA-binding GntR family transcriptional regulator
MIECGKTRPLISATGRGMYRRQQGKRGAMSLETARSRVLPAMQVSRETLQDRVYREVCALILNGEIAPGRLVTIQSLSDAFGVSAMPVREALQRLTAAKALTVISGRSIGVPPLTAERLEDLTRVRREIEGTAGAWAAENVAEADRAALAGHLKTLARAADEGNVKVFLRANHEFHFGIYRASRSEVLLAIIESLWLQVSPFFNLLHGSGNYAVANVRHEEMLAALDERDGPAVRAAILADIDAAAAVLLPLLPRAD